MKPFWDYMPKDIQTTHNPTITELSTRTHRAPARPRTYLSLPKTPSAGANWRQGEDVIIAGSVSDDEARKQYPEGWTAPKPYLRIVHQPRG